MLSFNMKTHRDVGSLILGRIFPARCVATGTEDREGGDDRAMEVTLHGCAGL